VLVYANILMVTDKRFGMLSRPKTFPDHANSESCLVELLKGNVLSTGQINIAYP